MPIKNPTNVEKVTTLMEHSKNGSMMQAFVIAAIENYSKQVAKADLSAMENSFISPEIWKSCADEALTKIQ